MAEIWKDSGISAVFIATRHDLHAELVIAALKAGKQVFVEKPLCIRPEELDAIEECIRSLGDACPILTVGFNRRFAPANAQLQRFLAGASPCACSPGQRATRHRNGCVSSISYQAGGDHAFLKRAHRGLRRRQGGHGSGGKVTRAKGHKDKGHKSKLEAFLAAGRAQPARGGGVRVRRRA